MASVVVSNLAETIRQAEATRSEANAKPVREPFCEKENPWLGIVPNVGANVQEFVGGDWLQKPFGPRAADPRTHPHERERDNADECQPIAQVEFEWNLPLQYRGIS